MWAAKTCFDSVNICKRTRASLDLSEVDFYGQVAAGEASEEPHQQADFASIHITCAVLSARCRIRCSTGFVRGLQHHIFRIAAFDSNQRPL